jgi:UDP-GlcNAc:undecaprenyl-phosphate/decaprenyl-phosphate GlcNAc-1-phosphate transferase
MSDYRNWISAVGAFAITVAALLALRPIAYAVNLLDRPGGHKTHHGVVPVIGGLGMLLGLTFGLVSAGNTLGELQHFLVSAVLLAVVGMLDDRFNVAPSVRLTAQFVAVLPMFFLAGVRLESFGDLIGAGPLDVRNVSLFATAIVAIAAVNAFNMLDGLDGLAGGISLVAALLMLALPHADANVRSVALIGALCASITGFLLFNIPVRWNRGVRCFMGDAGSTLLGFTLAWLMIGASQGSDRLAAPVTMAWLVAVPATDLVWSVLRRLSRGQSPLHADNEHLHHMLLRSGLGVRAVFAVMMTLSLFCGLTGVFLERTAVPEWLSFCALLLAGASLVLAGRRADLISRLFPESHHRSNPFGSDGPTS